MKPVDLSADYRNLRLCNIFTPEYRHLLWLLFWPGYLLRYVLIENWNPAAEYTVIHCAADDWIPFCEGFVVFYVLWYVLIVGMHLYTALFDIKAFRSYSKFLLLSMSLSTVCFLVFPSCQELRPDVFPRENGFTELVELLYTVDTNTNVLPSEHVIGAVGVFLTARNCERLRSEPWMLLISAMTVLICLSTLFLKQHSLLDAVAAFAVCAVVYWPCFRWKAAE